MLIFNTTTNQHNLISTAMHSYLPFLLILPARYLGNDTVDSEDEEDDKDDAENSLVRTGGDDDDNILDLFLILAATLILQKGPICSFQE